MLFDIDVSEILYASVFTRWMQNIFLNVGKYLPSTPRPRKPHPYRETAYAN